jgi:hypothetical protein
LQRNRRAWHLEDEGRATARPGGRTTMGEKQSAKVQLAPLLRTALASRQPGEDLDEAILRALKTAHPEHGALLLGIVAEMIDAEAKSANEDREQAVQRLAAAESGPEITLRTAGVGPLHASFESAVYRIGDKTYRSLDELPPHLRRAIEAALPPGMRSTLGAAQAEGQPAPLEQDKRVRIVRGAGATARTGCGMALLVALWRLVWG